MAAYVRDYILPVCIVSLERIFFDFFLSVALQGRSALHERGHSLRNYCVTVCGSILMQFSPFFGGYCPFRRTSSHFIAR